MTDKHNGCLMQNIKINQTNKIQEEMNETKQNVRQIKIKFNDQNSQTQNTNEQKDQKLFF